MTPNHSFKVLSLVTLLFGFSSFGLYGQKKGSGEKKATEVKFGDITPENFDPSIYSFDSTADAVILYDKGYSHFVESNEGWFKLIFERHQRIKVLKKNGLDAANFMITQYKDAKNEERVEKLKASTFNLENGKVIETKLGEKEIFKDQLNKNYSLTKFGLPNVKEGSIIEVSYTVISDFMFNLRPWEFQGAYPRVHTEYKTSIPDFFVYVQLKQGYLPFNKVTTTSSFKRYTLMLSDDPTQSRRPYEIQSNESVTIWQMDSVPAMKREPFTTTLDNHVAKIDFQLREYRFPNQEVRPVMASWEKLGEALMNDEEFGANLNKGNNWLNDDVATITRGATTDLEKAKALYVYLRDKFSLKSAGGKYMTDNQKNTWKNMKGNTADANLMMVTLLKVAGINAYPVILSTRDNGIANEFYPLISQYNYVVCVTEIEGKTYYLDATNPMLGFGILPLDCYNGHARVVTNLPLAVYLKADDVKESKTTVINLFADNSKPWEGSVVSTLGVYESLGIRERIKEKGQTALETDIKNALPAEMEMKDLQVEALKDYDKKVNVKYTLDCKSLQEEDILYINPLMGEVTKENLFAAAERNYPVEMPYTFRETIISNIKLPEGFVVDELPKPTRVKLDDDQGIFEYLIQSTEDMVQLRCVIDLKKANFPAEQYATLRDFYTYIVKKQSEQIVLKKKS
jgi:Domain of Unknown Function with PDB structure (DUF3857)/Transglutaminase-like superfamily